MDTKKNWERENDRDMPAFHPNMDFLHFIQKMRFDHQKIADRFVMCYDDDHQPFLPFACTWHVRFVVGKIIHCCSIHTYFIQIFESIKNP